MINKLIELGFDIIQFEDFSFAEQVKIAFNSKVLVSLHGAGLTNMLFMDKGNYVVELRQENDQINNCYFSQ